jgi:hypothetical protein
MGVLVVKAALVAKVVQTLAERHPCYVSATLSRKGMAVRVVFHLRGLTIALLG